MSLRKQLRALYRGTPLPQLYTLLKLSIIPFEEFSRYLPQEGRILEIGCGYGYVSNYLSLERGRRAVIGNDPAADRVRVAQQTIGDRRNIEFVAADSRDLPVAPLDGAVIADVLHHVPYADQEHILRDLHRKLKPGGVLVIRETDKKFRLRYLLFNCLLEWVLYPRVEKLRFRSAAEWVRLLQGVGYTVQKAIPNRPLSLYLTVTFVCVTPGPGGGPGQADGSATWLAAPG